MKGIILQITTMALGVFLILGSGGGGGDDTSTDTTGSTVENSDNTIDNTNTPIEDTRRPNTPSGVNARAYGNSLLVGWDLDPEADDADSYQVCYATESIQEFDSCTTYTGAALETVYFRSADFTVIEGLRYYVRVRAQAGNGRFSTPSLNVTASPFGHGFNDTGITLCGSDTENNLSCPVQGFENQDGDNGLDTLSAPNEDGDAGFSFTKLDGNGSELAESANEWACIKDNVTGLIWEAKTLNNKDDLFQWYNTLSFNNAGSSGHDASGEALCVGFDASDPTSYCNTQAYVDRVNAGSHCGLTNWVMPSRQELTSIVHYGEVEPAIEALYFSNTATALYWSGTPTFSSSSASDFAWATSFQYGGSAKQNKQEKLRVRLVNHGQ